MGARPVSRVSPPTTGPALLNLGIYLVTDPEATRGRALEGVVAACLDGGVQGVQLRAKALGTRPLLDLALAVRRLTVGHGARLLVNERADLAIAAGADGVHLPADGLPVEVARRLVGRDRLVGVSTHSVAEAQAASAAGADYLVFGPVYETPSKRSYGAPLGLGMLAEVCRRVALPVVAIGGITAARAPEVRAQGAAGVAVIRALLEAEDPRAAAAELRSRWESRPTGGP